jgi:carboxyl-terminal processing protease
MDGRAKLSLPRPGAWLLLLALLAAGCATTPAPRIPLDGIPAAQHARAEQNLRVYDKVWGLVADRHYDPKLGGVDWPAAGRKYGELAAAAPDVTALYAALNGMLGLLHDSHTRAIPPASAGERHDQTRVLTGIVATRIEGRWAVMEVMPGSPAEAAGVRPGWIARTRNGEPLGERFAFPLRAGEVVRWGFLDQDDRPVELALTARPVTTAPRQFATTLPDGVVLLRFDGFDATDRRWLSARLKEHRDAPGVIIDLRRNPGGDSFSLGTSIGEFFDRAVDVGRFLDRDGDSSPWRSFQLGSAHYRGRVAVLVGGGTASSAEIFSAVLQANGRATIVGRHTAGAVLGSRFHALPDGGELQLSMRDYVSPRGMRLEGNGVEPDVTVSAAPTLADLRAGRDPELEAALAVLRAPVPAGR